eukprot:454071-Prymnesium_polylepis.1
MRGAILEAAEAVVHGARSASQALFLSSLDLYHAWTSIWYDWFAAVLRHPPSPKPTLPYFAFPTNLGPPYSPCLETTSTTSPCSKAAARARKPQREMPEARGVTVKDVASHDFVIAYAAHLKRIGKIEVPKWADLVKTATHKELAPYDPDWYYIRAAAIARRVYLRAGTG